MTENSPTSSARNSLFLGPNNFKFGTETHVVWSYRPYQNLGEIDHDWHSHVFDDVICKPPIVYLDNLHVLKDLTSLLCLCDIIDLPLLHLTECGRLRNLIMHSFPF